MISYYLQRALAAKQREFSRKPVYDLDQDRGAFSTVYRELAHSAESWIFNARSLIDINNWNLSRLVNERGKYRKPAIHLVLEITSKDNLALDWLPTPSSLYHSVGEGDFIRKGGPRAVAARYLRRGSGHHGRGFPRSVPGRRV